MDMPIATLLDPKSVDDIDQLLTRGLEAFRKTQVSEEPHYRTREMLLTAQDGSTVWTEVVTRFYHNPWTGRVELHGVTRDITRRRALEEEREMLRNQLHQAQKLESIGRLAGGIAHDYNNMLGVILGNTELALEQVQPDSTIHGDLMEIRSAAERSAVLTRQLLAFARRQDISPRVLDFNQTVESMLRMLHRMLGELIAIEWRPQRDLWPVRMDPSQIDQILANLCVNARDAIDEKGVVVITTENVTLDTNDCANHIGFRPGDFIRLSVTDDGCGMDDLTLASIFEPFFTTKSDGKGTGLGLATVYGIVSQNNGFIDVQSTPGQGSTFHIYIPRHQG